MKRGWDTGDSDKAVENYKKLRRPDHSVAPQLETYGTLDCGYETMTDAWPLLTHRFSVGATWSSTAQLSLPGNRAPKDLLLTHPVDLLATDMSTHKYQSGRDCPTSTRWEQLIETATTPPKVVFESWKPGASLWDGGPISKATIKRWTLLGYATRSKVVASDRCGGAVQQTRLLVVRLHSAHNSRFTWPTLDDRELKRPSSNLLTPPGLTPRHMIKPAPPPSVRKVTNPLTEPIPEHGLGRTNPWLKCKGGYRQARNDELGKALGCPTGRVSQPESTKPDKGLGRTTSVYHWEYLSQAYQGRDPGQPETFFGLTSDTGASVKKELRRLHSERPPDPAERPDPFHWTPPDLTPGSQWWKLRVNNLQKAAQNYGDVWIDLVNKGLNDLRHHRRNYDSGGARPNWLKILWWEFPKEHWDDLRNGSSMNFLEEPDHCIHENGEMDDDQRQVASEFVDELINLGVLRRPPPGVKIKTTTPLFVLPKPGQPGQWRVIANMKEGGQNEKAANDPVYLNRPVHILDQMYTGGWTSIVDASKFFYQFKTRPEDYPYLGIIHPRTGEEYTWWNLPMGSTNSPSCAGRYGLALLRLIQEKFTSNSGHMKANCWWTGLVSQDYNPALGHGYVLTRKDGGPAVRFWVHVDDFCIHGPDKRSTEEALSFFLDTALDVGMLCHPKKLVPPTQTPLYTGFIFDTRGIPTLRVPTEKREKALAMVDHLLGKTKEAEVSRLVLAVVSGVLESLTEATPSRLGHTYLRNLYDLVHEEGLPTGAERYYTHAHITTEIKQDLSWWKSILEYDLCRPARGTRAATLVPTFGDGSGTGTGGTIEMPNSEMVMWMGQWAPLTQNETSNWKEMKTLMLTLQEVAKTAPESVKGSTLFYFTDNSPTYFIAASGSSTSPGLHRLIEQIRHLELILGCKLQVIHIPGKAIIAQGTDGLSRGVWISELHPDTDPKVLTESIFRPATVQPSLIHAACEVLGWESDRCYVSPWTEPFRGSGLLHRYTCHFPPPEMARQTLIFYLEAWVESPLDSGAIFFVPRVLSAFWHGLSRHIEELPMVPAESLMPPTLLPIPLIVLVIKPHLRCLRSNAGMDSHRSAPRGAKAHKQQADQVRGLQGTPVRPSY